MLMEGKVEPWTEAYVAVFNAGCCFVKYATSEDADRAIRSLHNQITLPGVTTIDTFSYQGQEDTG